MAGGLTQLVAYGAQDIYLTGQPQITFFKTVYRRHTNFAVESIEQAINGNTANFASRLNFTLSRNADLVGAIYIEATMPTTVNMGYVASLDPLPGLLTATHNIQNGWMNGVGNYLIQSVDVEIGGQLIDRQFGMWMDIWSDLSMTDAEASGYGMSVGKDFNLAPAEGFPPEFFSTTGAAALYGTAVPATACGWPLDIMNAGPAIGAGAAAVNNPVLRIPLQFWFCKNPGLALPLVALQYHEIKISLTIESLTNLIFSVDVGAAIDAPAVVVGVGTQQWHYQPLSTTFATEGQFGVDPTTVNMAAPLRAFCDYYYLDTTERRKFSQNAHEYLIEQIQHPIQRSAANSGNDTGTTITTRRLNLSHPVKELVWCFPRPRATFAPMNDFTWYPGVLAGVAPAGALQGIYEASEFDVPINAPQSLVNVAGGVSKSRKPNVNAVAAPLTALTGTYLGAGDASLVSCVLLLNGNRAFNQRDGEYFRLTQPQQHHTRSSIGIPAAIANCRSNYVYSYSFALRPEEHQPSGTCNFSRIDNAQLEYTLKPVELGGAPLVNPREISIFATNYNILRIMSGMGGLAYSN